MSTTKRLAIYERRLKRVRSSVKDALALAGLPASTYYRWKNGSRMTARLSTWERFEKAVDKLSPPGAKAVPKPKKPKPPPGTVRVKA